MEVVLELDMGMGTVWARIDPRDRFGQASTGKPMIQPEHLQA